MLPMQGMQVGSVALELRSHMLWHLKKKKRLNIWKFPDGPVVCASSAGGMGLIPGQRIKILYAMWCDPK